MADGETKSRLLFDDFVRSNQAPKADSEPIFAFYNHTARPGMNDLRHMLDGWFGRVPEAARQDLRSRFRSASDADHQGAFFELYIHELFSGLGFALQVHPEVQGNGGGRPDFLATRDGRRLYVEATAAMPALEESAADRRAAVVLDAVNALHSDDYFLDVSIAGSPVTQPSCTKLKRELALWLGGLNYDQIARAYEHEGYQALPVLEWKHEGWRLRFRPLPRRVFTRGKHNVRLIASRSGEFKSYDARISLYNSLHKKAKRYGKLDAPLMICVNALEDMAEPYDLLGAIFGKEGIAVRRDGRHLPYREPNGVWIGPKGAKNTSSSAILGVFRLNPWNVGTVVPEIYHHPKARNPIPQTAFPFPQHVANADKTALDRQAGIGAANFLELPARWARA